MRPKYRWEHRFGIEWNTLVLVDYSKEEATTSASEQFDAAVGSLVAATPQGWVAHHDTPILYWTDAKAVVNTNYDQHASIARSLQQATTPSTSKAK